jgi:hypothetical protein
MLTFKNGNMKNKLKIIGVVFICVFFSVSCSNVLEEELTGDLTADGVFVDEEGIDFVLNGAYASLSSFIGATGTTDAGWTLIGFGTDTYTNGSDGNYKYFNTYDSDLNASSPVVTESWNEFYRGINAANTVINRAPNALEDNDEKLLEVTAQAKFLRGYIYFWLARVWGPVHYTEEETQEAQTEASRMPLAELYPKIIEDLKFAEENLPGEQNEYGKATKWAAKAVLADLYLFRQNYEEAAKYSEDIISNGPFSVLENFSDLWDPDNEQNSEVIWSIQFADNLVYDNGGNPAHLFFLMQYDVLPGMKRDTKNGRPWKRFKPTDYLLDLYDMEDTRYDGTFKTVWYANDPSSAPEDVAVGDTAVYLPRERFTEAEKNAKPYGVNIYNQDEYTDKFYPSTQKWLEQNRISVNDVSGSKDFVTYRLAEIYLIAAEANALKSSSNQTKALEYLNEVRMRAYHIDDPSELPNIAMVDIDVILEERAKELAQEGKRWFDLVRTDNLVELVKLYNSKASPNIQGYHKLRPIPLTQIDRTSTEFEQNPGY